MERTWEISDIDGSNKRTVTLTQYRAEIDAAKTKALAIYRANVRTVSVHIRMAKDSENRA